MHNVQFTMTNVQSVLLIGQSVVEFIEVFCSMTNCRICRRIVMEHWPDANEKRCILYLQPGEAGQSVSYTYSRGRPVRACSIQSGEAGQSV